MPQIQIPATIHTILDDLEGWKLEVSFLMSHPMITLEKGDFVIIIRDDGFDVGRKSTGEFKDYAKSINEALALCVDTPTVAA